MGIQNKVSGILVALLILLMGTLILLVNSQTSRVLKSQVNDEIALLHEANVTQAETIFHGFEIGSRSSVEMGDMDAFSDLLVDLASIQNVRELGIVAPNGKVNFTNDQSLKERYFDRDIFDKAKKTDQFLKHETTDELIVTRASFLSEGCIMCHESQKTGDVAGVFFLRYDMSHLHTLSNSINKQMETQLGETLKSLALTGLGGIVIAALAIFFLLGKLVKKPLLAVENIFDNMAAGRFDRRLEVKSKDEIGHIGTTINNFADFLQNDVLVSLQMLAAGDLTFKSDPLSQDDTLRIALKKVRDDLTALMLQVQTGANQIAAGASQVADASQSLSEGATSSASSVEQISASMNELSGQTKANADNANQANKLASQAHSAADNGNRQMQQMVTAMSDINESGQNISKIIKVIDEIAFQTNLLALNAAVEAARAGQHGKGFAVVAEEVRNLAARSAKAAQETAALIEGSVEKAKHGVSIANSTSAAFTAIVGEIQKVNDLISEIAASSSEQSQGITEINEGIARIDDVTQQNTANAEEGAASAEQLSSQSAQLNELLAHFKLRETSRVGRSGSSFSGGSPDNYAPITRKSYVSKDQKKIAAKPSSHAKKAEGWGMSGGAGKNETIQIALDDSEFGRF
ncbi:MAG: methyl-accepting chemotaxis protein [Desulfuromonadaceae bacterium]|nr:methyl-accepting chemotaxis protein [Desulfuromonadaceae bacterium]